MMSTRGALEEEEQVVVAAGWGALAKCGWDLWLFKLSREHVEPAFFKGFELVIMATFAMSDLLALCSTVVEYAVVRGIFGTSVIQACFYGFPMLLDSNSLLKKVWDCWSKPKEYDEKSIFFILWNSWTILAEMQPFLSLVSSKIANQHM